jgi:hypothetical protein
MDKQYFYPAHEYVMFDKDCTPEDGDNGPFPIIHTVFAYGIRRIWISMSLHDRKPTGSYTVSDGHSAEDGDSCSVIYSIPESHFVFLTEEEAEQVVAIRKVDSDLLRWARG